MLPFKAFQPRDVSVACLSLAGTPLYTSFESLLRSYGGVLSLSFGFAHTNIAADVFFLDSIPEVPV